MIQIDLDEIVRGTFPLIARGTYDYRPLLEDSYKRMRSKKEQIIDVVRIEDKIHILGRSGPTERLYRYSKTYPDSKYFHHFIFDISTGELIEEDSFERAFDSNKKGLSAARFLSFSGVGLPFLIPLAIHHLRPKVVEKIRKSDEFRKKVFRYHHENYEELKEAIKDIKLYQGTLEEVSDDLGIDLERVDTGNPETFIREKDIFKLRVLAYAIGGDALVHYQQGSSIGTPVRFKK